MAVIDATDASLRDILKVEKRVLVKFIDADCDICKALAPIIESMSEELQYREIVFLRMNAAENPVSAVEVKLTKAPFFVGYRKRSLVQCRTMTTEAEVRELLGQLLV